jgi:TrmH family RNA methyltransferase
MAAVARERIDSPRNPRVKALVRLHARREREREDRTLVEGAREVGRALTAGVEVEAAYLAPSRLAEAGRRVAGALEDAGVPVVELAEAAFAKLSRRQHPDGVAAVIRPPRRTLTELVLPPSPLLLVAVATEKPGNLGGLVRSADAAGADAVLAVGGAGTDPWNPGVIRASMGSVFALPVLPCEGEAALAWLTARGLRLVATAPAAARDLWDEDLTGPIALALGPERAGLPAAWLEAAQARVRVPMRGAADSLNVSVTGALLLFEAVRQRGGRAGRAER